MTIFVQAAEDFNDSTDADGGRSSLIADPPNVTVKDAGEGVFRITLCPGSRITAEDGIVVRERLLALTGGARSLVLLQITGVEFVSRDAVRFFSEAATITAFAILGGTPVDRVIAHGLRGLPMPQCPSQYFDDELAALAWLRAPSKTTGPGLSFAQ